MALIHCHFHSDVLGVASSLYAILPQPSSGEIGVPADAAPTRHPTLWLLHGLSDDHSAWTRQTSIERYALARGLAVVMPAVNRSFYTDMVHGPKYWTFISEELPRLARALLPLSDRPADNFVAGLSMGGYGALKLALTHPDRYAAAASLSGALDIATRYHPDQNPRREMADIWPDLTALAGTPYDIFHLAAERMAARDTLPALFACCGTEDFVYPDNTRFRDHARAIGLPLTYEDGPGDHNWEYWDTHIQRIIDWLPLADTLR